VIRTVNGESSNPTLHRSGLIVREGSFFISSHPTEQGCTTIALAVMLSLHCRVLQGRIW